MHPGYAALATSLGDGVVDCCGRCEVVSHLRLPPGTPSRERVGRNAKSTHPASFGLLIAPALLSLRLISPGLSEPNCSSALRERYSAGVFQEPSIFSGLSGWFKVIDQAHSEAPLRPGLSMV